MVEMIRKGKNRSPVLLQSFGAFIAITRPFTLLPPFLGMISGAFAALGSRAVVGEEAFAEGLFSTWHFILAGGIMVAMLNAASNILNQVTELDLDRINKPQRILPGDRMRGRTAILYSFALYLISLWLAWWIEPMAGMHHVFWSVLPIVAATILYSVKPPYLKSRGWIANITIAIPRGCLLKVAGWGCVASVWNPEPWLIGIVFMLFLIGASSSKDFSDYSGDRDAGVGTLVVRLGPEAAAKRIAPFFIYPWGLLLVGSILPIFFADLSILHCHPWVTLVFVALLSAYGTYITHLLQHPDRVSTEGNHPAWKHMYFMMMAAQIGLILAYLPWTVWSTGK